jgi:hypothetical protein
MNFATISMIGMFVMTSEIMERYCIDIEFSFLVTDDISLLLLDANVEESGKRDT